MKSAWPAPLPPIILRINIIARRLPADRQQRQQANQRRGGDYPEYAGVKGGHQQREQEQRQGRTAAHQRLIEADADAALASYEQQVLLALEESANAFSDYGKRQERLVSLVRQSEASRAAAQQAAIRYREGTTDFLVLLDAEREQLSAEDAQAQAEVELYRGIVAIYRSLGGGWQPSA